MHTEIEIEAPPSMAREAFLDFAAILTYTEFLKEIVPQNQGKKDLEPGDTLIVTTANMTLNPVVEVNSFTEFTWHGTLGSAWLFNGAHSFKFLPVGEGDQKTRIVHAEFRGVLASILLVFSTSIEGGFQRFNEELMLSRNVGKRGLIDIPLR